MITSANYKPPQEKATRSNFPLNMTNDMIAEPSHWKERLSSPKCDKEDDPYICAGQTLCILYTTIMLMILAASLPVS